MVDQVFKTPFARYMWDVTKRYSQFIMENADPNVPGRTPIDLTNKLIEAVKVHPVKADELIMSYQFGREVPQPGNTIAWKPPTDYVRPPEADAPPQPVFKQKASMPEPEPGEVKPHPRAPAQDQFRRQTEMGTQTRSEVIAEKAQLKAPPQEQRVSVTPGTDPARKPSDKRLKQRKKRQKAILAQRGPER